MVRTPISERGSALIRSVSCWRGSALTIETPEPP